MRCFYRDNSDHKRGLVDPYVKTTRTVSVRLFTTEHHRIPQNTTELHRIPQNTIELAQNT